jgi:hypothetical protein
MRNLISTSEEMIIAYKSRHIMINFKCQYYIYFCRFAVLSLSVLIFIHKPVAAQGGRYWDQNLNSEAALLSGNVVAGEGGIAAIYYNPATISQMTRNSLSLSANLFSLYFFKAKNALGEDFPADRTQLSIYPRIITLTINPKKNPDLTIELAYFTKANEYLQINKGTTITRDIISSNPGIENYTGEYYLRMKYQDYNGGAGFGYKISEKLSVGFSALINYKDDQYYNLITADAFTMADQVNPVQYLSDSRYHLKYNMFDVRLATKLGMRYKSDSWSFGTNISIPSIKIFGNGTVVKQIEYSNIHKVEDPPVQSNKLYAARQRKCPAHFKDPLSIAAGLNYYSPSGKSIILFTTEYFFGLDKFDYIEAGNEPGEDGYHYAPGTPGSFLTFSSVHKPVLNAGIAFKKIVSEQLMLSGGFRTDFNYQDQSVEPGIIGMNEKTNYSMDVYHFNYGLGYNFKRGSITLGMQFSYGQEKNRDQIVNLKDPIEFISENLMPLTGPVGNVVDVRYFDVTIYFGFIFNFMKEQ